MLTLLRWLSRLPLPLLHLIGGAVGWLGFASSPSYRRRLRENAALAGLSQVQQRAAVGEAGKLVAELPWVWLSAQARPISRHCRWEGAELIERALDAGHGLVLLTPHMGCFEICAHAYAERYGARQPLTVLYRPAKQAWLRELEETVRERPGLASAPATLAGVRQMIRAMRRGEGVGLLPDQVPPEGMGVWAPFFGRMAYTMTLASRLAQQSGAVWLLMWTERLAGGRGFVVRVSEPSQALPNEAGDDAALQAQCAQIMNQEMERLILQNPAQYLWGYNRYKRPRTAGSTR